MTSPIHCTHCGRYLGTFTEATRLQPCEADVSDDVIQDDEGNWFCDLDCQEQEKIEREGNPLVATNGPLGMA